MSRGMTALLASGLLAAWLFFQLYSTHQASIRLNDAEMRRDRAEFDVDFSRAFGGAPKPELEQRATAAAKALTAEQVKASATQAAVDSKMAEIGGKIDKELEHQLRQ